MGIDWGFAGEISGVGFGLIFIVLIILAVVVWLIGLVFIKISTGKGEASNKKKGV